MAKNELNDFLVSATSRLNDEYKRISLRTLEDPGTAGDAGEENWATLLREWIPATYQVVTKGRILFSDGDASPQIDILVLIPDYPRALLDKKLYLSGGVVAAFECKLTLKAVDIRKTMANCVKIKRLENVETGTPYKELHTHIIYGLLAHSHSWKKKNSKPIDNVDNSLMKYDYEYVEHPREMLDLLCIADTGTWVSNKHTFWGPAYFERYFELKMNERYGEEGSASTSYQCSALEFENNIKRNYSPIGAAFIRILDKLSREDTRLERLCGFFYASQLKGFSRGYSRLWDSSIYSDEIRQDIINGKANSRKNNDDWSMVYH